MRLGDCCMLKWDSVDLDKRIIQVVPQKTARYANSRPVTIPLHLELQEMLMRKSADERRGFVLGKLAEDFALRRWHVSKKLSEIFTLAGIKTSVKIAGRDRLVPDATFHSLRHTFVSLSVNAGVPLAVVQSLVGHNSTAMTRHYYHVNETVLRQAVDAIPRVCAEQARPGKRPHGADGANKPFRHLIHHGDYGKIHVHSLQDAVSSKRKRGFAGNIGAYGGSPLRLRNGAGVFCPALGTPGRAGGLCRGLLRMTGGLKDLSRRLHGRLGDFWWYSLMVFCALRAADVLNAFVGVWLVPKYVDPAELGAVMPLANFANFLALPAAVFANTFRNELSRLSAAREFGKLKTLMRGVFIASAVFLFVAAVASRFMLPLFLERIRIVEGSLGILIIVSSFIGVVSPVYYYALQTLKKFREYSLISIFGAPVRLVTMLVAMPFRALSGYFAGQAATPAFNMVASVFCLRKELSVLAEPYWSREIVKRFAKLMGVFALGGAASGLCALVESTVLRQRLPDLDSAGYYMATRFSEIASFLTGTLAFTIFPFAADLSSKGKRATALIFKSTAAIVAFSALVALPFLFFGRQILEVLPHGEQYSCYWWSIPWLIGIGCLAAFTGFYTTAEISANRFGYLKWMVPLDLCYPAVLLLVTGYGYFTPYIPASWNGFLAAHNIRSLGVMLCWMTGINLVKAATCLVSALRHGKGAAS